MGVKSDDNASAPRSAREFSTRRSRSSPPKASKASRCARSPTPSNTRLPSSTPTSATRTPSSRSCATGSSVNLAKAFANFGALDPVERLRQIGYIYIDFAVKHPSHFRFMFLMPHP